MLDHRIVILGLPASRLSTDLVGDVCAEVHARGVEPDKKRLVSICGVCDEALCFGDDLVVDGLHPLLGERARVLDAPICVAVNDPARSESLAEVREVFLRRIVGIFGFFLCVQVVQIAKEFIKAVVGRQELVAVPEVVLAELSSR